MSESKRCISVSTRAPSHFKSNSLERCYIWQKSSLSITTNILSATLPHWSKKHSEWQDSYLLSPSKLCVCYHLLWLNGKWLAWSLESCISSSSAQSSMEHTLTSRISLLLSHLTQGLREKKKNHLNRLQQWVDEKSYPFLWLKKNNLSLSGSQVWTITYINFSILIQRFLCLHLLSQNTGSSKVSCFPNHRQAGHILNFWIPMRPLFKWFLSKLCLSLAFNQEHTLHAWNFIETHSCLYLQTGRPLFWLPFKFLLVP